MVQTKEFLTWLKEDYFSEEKILAAYEKETARHREELHQYYIDRMTCKLSPCNGCTSYATCHRPGAQICQKAAQFNDAVLELANQFIGQQEKKAMMTADQQLEAIAREVHIANLKGSSQVDRYKNAVQHIQNILQPY